MYDIAEEMKKPPAERNVLPLVDKYCPGCTKDCGMPHCPLTQIKWGDGPVEALPTPKPVETVKSVRVNTAPKGPAQYTLF